MTRRPPLTHIYLSSVSYGAMDLSLRLSAKRVYGPTVPAFGLLARIGVWFRLIFGGTFGIPVITTPLPHRLTAHIDGVSGGAYLSRAVPTDWRILSSAVLVMHGFYNGFIIVPSRRARAGVSFLGIGRGGRVASF